MQSNSKESIREKINSIRKNIHQSLISKKSKKIIENLISLNEYKQTKTIMPYVALDYEVDTKEFIKNELSKTDKTVLVPFVQGKNLHACKITNFLELKKSTFDVLEPVNKQQHKGKIDLIIVPGIAFNKNGSRLGFGGGFYDRFLEKNKDSLKVALAFEEQIVDIIPTEQHDVPMDIIITEKRILRCK